ncbi:MAG TPA: UDP-N-acetylmuramoyl-tripeptide--D-alanyl-D-alanine ligase, partial [Alphaproteobacteria bacterium]|nr:UDP-N-acetylmuramoyl-tripeptide--D-alanyl-D-alanine ligase [Alphaproteobacteria bacterium]
GTRVNLQLAGDQWFSALAGLLAVLPAAGLRDPAADTAAFIAAAGAVKPLRGRGQTLSLPGIDGGAARLIDESYNASPAAMEAALRLLVQTPTTGRRIAVLGDMLELDDPATEHARIGRLIAAMPIDVVHVCGAYADTVLAEVEPGQRGLSAPKALDLFTGIAQSIHGGDTWLVKGSLGSEVHLLVDKLTP